jgi:hypothetical protein
MTIIGRDEATARQKCLSSGKFKEFDMKRSTVPWGAENPLNRILPNLMSPLASEQLVEPLLFGAMHGRNSSICAGG